MAEQQYEIQNKRMLIIAAVLGLVTVILVNWHGAQIRKEYEEQMVDVLVAQSDLKSGDMLASENITYTRIPRRLVPEEFKGDLVMGPDRDSILGMALRVDVEKGKILRWRYVTAGRSISEKAVLPKAHHRLVALKVNRDTCPSNLRVGMQVDLVTNTPSQTGGIQTVKIMEGVVVKAINDNGKPGAGERNIEQVTIEVPSEDSTTPGQDSASLLEAFKTTGMAITVQIRPEGERAGEVKFNPVLIPLMQWEGRGRRG